MIDDAPRVYAAEDRAAVVAAVRRFDRFADAAVYVSELVCSSRWEALFPDAPLDVTVVRRPHNASASVACVDAAAESAVVALIDRHGWGLETVLHELAHVASHGAGHGPEFRAALLSLWRVEAGIVAAVVLRDELRAAGFPVDLAAT